LRHGQIAQFAFGTADLAARLGLQEVGQGDGAKMAMMATTIRSSIKVKLDVLNPSSGFETTSFKI